MRKGHFSMTMTKRERFLNFLASKPVDRVPVAFFHHFVDEFGSGLTKPENFEKNILGHKLSREKFDPDVIKIMNDTLMLAPVDASEVRTAADLRQVHAPSLDSEFSRKTVELTQRSLAFYEGSDAPVYITAFSPSMLLRTGMKSCPLPGGADGSLLLQFIREDPEAVAAALQNIAEDIIALNRHLLELGGIDGIYMSVNNQAGYYPEDFFRRYVAPCEQQMMAELNRLSPMNLLHICGYHGLANNLELFTGYEAAAYNIAVYAEGVPLSEGKKLFGGKPVFGGYAQDTVIYTGTEQEVKEAAWKILDECGQIGVMLGADCTVPTDIDDSRLEWVRQAAIEYAAR